MTQETLRGVSIVGISGSPSPNSSTGRVLDTVLARLAANGADVVALRLRDLSPEALIDGDVKDPKIAAALEQVEGATGIVVATPIYKAAYSGLLKLFLDLMPQFGLAGKTVLPVATGGSLAHALALDYALRPVLQSMGARHIVQGMLIPSANMRATDAGLDFDEPVAVALNEAIHHMQLSIAMSGQARDPLLGHPRPDRTTPAGGLG